MQNYSVKLQADASTSFFGLKAAQSVDLDANKKLTHELSINADVTSPFSVGLIIGASGSGKTTLAKQIFGEEKFKCYLNKSSAVIDQFPENMPYDDRAQLLTGVGLSQVPCWIKPAGTLSNGQQARAEAALQLAFMKDDVAVIDEWTSVVDRNVAKAMSFCLAKQARRQNAKIVLISRNIIPMLKILLMTNESRKHCGDKSPGMLTSPPNVQEPRRNVT